MKKNWENPELNNLNVQNTNTEEQENCPENSAKCFCEYYHVNIFGLSCCGGSGGCSAPGYICKYTGKKPCITKKCSCTDKAAPIS